MILAWASPFNKIWSDTFFIWQPYVTAKFISIFVYALTIDLKLKIHRIFLIKLFYEQSDILIHWATIL